jgi:hypothetical protein
MKLLSIFDKQVRAPRTERMRQETKIRAEENK